MKVAQINKTIFNPALKKIDTGIKGFDLRKLYAIINQTTGTLIYGTSLPSKKVTAVSGSVITLEYDTTTMNSNDVIQVLYDDYEDVEIAQALYEVSERLAFLAGVKGTLADLRVTVINTVPTTVSSGTITVVGTLSNQTSFGNYAANPQIPALTNLAANTNIQNISNT